MVDPRLLDSWAYTISLFLAGYIAGVLTCAVIIKKKRKPKEQPPDAKSESKS